MISEAQAQTLLAASNLAYLPAGPSPGSGYQFLQAFPDAETGFLALVYRNPDTKKCIVAFTGTQLNFQDAYSDLNLGWQQWSNNKDPLFQFLAALKADPELGLEQVDFTGHSLGGALAQYAAYEYAGEAEPGSVTLTTFNALGGAQGILQNLGVYDSARLAGVEVNHFRVASDMVSLLGEGHVGGNVRVIDFPTSDFVAAHRLETSFLDPIYAGYQLTALPFATPNYLHVSTGQQLGAALGNLFNNGTYNEFEAALRTTGALLLVLQLAPANEIDQVIDAMFPQYAHVNWGTVRSILPVSGGAVALGGAGLILAAGIYEGVQGATERLAEVKAFLSRIMGESFDSLNTLPTGQASLRMSVYLAATSGIGLGGSVLGQALSSFSIDHGQLTTHLLSGANWLTDSLNYLRLQANAAGQNAADFSARIAAGIYQEAQALTGYAADLLLDTTMDLESFLLDTAYGISNAVSEFLHDVPGTLFDLGRTLSFADLNPFTTAYAQVLEDPRLSSALRTALEEAQSIVQQAGQTVVIQRGMGPNPFDTPGFNPDVAPPVTVTLGESLFQMFSIYLPFAAGTGGQRIQLKLSGSGAGSFTLLTPDGELTQENGGFSVVVREGLQHLTVKLRSNDNVTSPSTLSLSAVLIDEGGQETHQEQVEGAIALANSGDIPTGDLPVINYFNGQQSVTWVGDNDSNEPLFNAGANHVVFGNGGFDVLDLSASAALFNHQISGGIGNDALHGGEGKDRLYGEEGFDLATGGGGDDVLYGGDTGDRLAGDSVFFAGSAPGHDYLDGGLGDDRLEGQAGDDTLHGGVGNDMLLGDDHAIYVNRPVGRDYLDGGDGNDYLFGGRGDDQLFGGQGNDLLRGDNKVNSDPELIFSRVPGSMVLSPTSANAFFEGDGGADYLDGGEGNDKLLGDGGDDLLLGGEGDDYLYGDEEFDLDIGINVGNDWLEGGAGNDHLFGDEGEDALFGGEGDDFLQGDYVNETGFADYLDGGAGNDVLGGAKGDDVLIGGDGQDLLQGGDDEDVLDGGADNDTLFGELGDDVLSGGDGDDQLSGGEGVDALDGGGGVDVLQGDEGDDDLAGGAGNDLLMGNTGEDSLFGESGNDELQGNSGDDLLAGGAGDDTIFGQEDDDALFGDEGHDTLWGGQGNDVLDGGLGDDALVGDDTDLVGGFGGADILTGGAGNDYLGGGGGSDTYLFNSGDGFDVIRDFAGEGNRLVFGSSISAEALIVTATANDSLVIRTGSGGDAVEILNFGTSDLTGSHPIDIFEFSEGTVLIYAQLVVNGLGISGGFGADTLTGTADGERIFGGAGNDAILGLDGADTLLGEDGEDRLEGGAGNDRLLGGSGNDQLTGGTGQDTYVFTSGGGIDTIQDMPGEGNRLVFGSGISRASLNLGFRQTTISGGVGEGEEGGEGGNSGTVLNYLVVRTGRSGDAVEIQWFDPANQSASLGVDQFLFGDGTTLTSSELLAEGLELVGTAGFDTLDGHAIYRTIRGLAGDDLLIGGTIDNVIEGGDGRDVLLGNGGRDRLSGGTGDDVIRGGDGDDVLNGDAGNDSLEGEAGDDVLVGGTGDDQLSGGGGNDTYRFNSGDGFDSLFDSGSGTDTDRVVFGGGITSSMVSLSSQFGQIVIKVGSGSEGIQSGSVVDVFGSQTIEQFQFSDGSSLNYGDLVARGFDINGTEFDDFLSGTNVIDRIRGGLGNDHLEGGEGNDSYFFNLGDGIDAIIDSALVGAGNEVVFGIGITSADLRLDLASDQADSSRSDLLIRVGTNDDAIQLDTFDRNNALDLRTVESFRFADGGTLTYEQLLARGFDLTGTDGDDQITGTSVADRIISGTGADVLRGGLGDDQLDGGADNDHLVGQHGNDTYVFGPGSGQDTIIEVQGSQDAIRFATGAAPSDVVVTRSHDDFVFSLNGGIDRLTVSHYFLAPLFQIELVQFADGTVWDQAFINNLVQPSITGTEGPDVLVGTQNDDRLVGLAGSDQLTGLVGNDLLDGGPGADQLMGGLGDDIYVVDEVGDSVIEAVGEGIDTIQSDITRTLEANVENLTLSGTGTINGTGNELNNVLTGNSAANVLTGGMGDDTYVVGTGDTVVELMGEGIDTVQTGVNATLSADLENLTLTGSASLTGTGNNLDNVLSADGSISILAGGDGNDTYVIGSNGDDDILVETPTGGIDTVIAGHDYRLPTNIENLTLLDPGVPDFASFSLIPYGSSEQSVTGYGNELANTLIGGRANNVLDGGLGADTLIGGAGHDIYIVDNVGDIVIEQANEGMDMVLSAVSHQLSANVESLALTGTASINGTGNALNNELRGNEGSNVLDGGAGNDALLGFGGADTYLFGRGSGRDTVFDSGAPGEIDTIQFDSTVTADDVEVYCNGFNLELVIRGTTDELTLLSFFGSPEYNQKQVRFADGTVWSSAELSARALIGNVVTGSFESETILGSDGHDGLIGSAGNDVLMGGRGKDTLYGDLTFQTLSGPQVIGDDTLIGGAGNDSLFDFRGNNLFDGGAGDDTLFLGTGVDRVLFGRGSGADHVTLDNNRNDIDLIEIAADITPAEVELTWRSDSTADILISDSEDRVTVQFSTDWFAVGPETTQAIVRFADGTQWSLAWSASNVDIPAATSSDDVLSAPFPSALAGLQGNDTYLLGSSGIPGNYAVIEAPNEGIDTVQSLFDYVLDPHVENLILAESRSSVLRNPERGTGNELDNLIIGNTGDNILDGGAGDDVLVGGIFRSVEEFFLFGTGSDILIGGAGDDVLMADGGNIVFSVDGADNEWLFLGGGSEFRSNVPRLADDLLIGGTGNDTYIVHSQEQTVVELENEGTDTVQSTVSYVLGEYVENLMLLASPEHYDEDGNVIPLLPLNGTGNELDNVLSGSEDENVLSGLTGHDTLVGRFGDDTLRGGAGYDTYLFNLGDGIDTIEDVAAAGEGNRIQFGVGISRNDLTVTHDEAVRTVTIQVGESGTDRLVLNSFDLTGVNGTPVVETLAFADGSTTSLASFFGPAITEGDDTVTTGAGDDVIDALGGDDIVDAGAGNDIITGGTGDDTLAGGPGDDTYIYNSGDGIDSINDASSPGEGNTLQFGPGIDPENLSLGVGSLLISVGTNGDAVHLTNFDHTNVFGPRTIETFRFADGTVLSYDQLLQRGFDLTGTDGNDSIFGTNVVDRFTTLTGDDVLVGGHGNDQLIGGGGSDTYIFNIGDGVDTIDDTVLRGAENRIQFGVGISHNDLTFTQDEAARTLTIQVGANGTDRLVLADFDPRGANGSLVVSALEFANGNVVNLVDLYPPNHAPTVAMPLINRMVAEGAPFTIHIPATTFADPDPDDVLTLRASLADGAPLPSWFSFDAATGTLSGTPDDAQVGSFDLTVSAADRENESVSDTFTLTITNVNETPTVMTPLADQTTLEDEAFSLTVPAATLADVDQVHGDTLLYSAAQADGSALPTWLTFDPMTRTFSGTPLNDDVGVLVLTVTATDAGNLSASDTFSIVVTNTNDAPTVVNPIENQSTNTGAAFVFMVPSTTFADVDAGDQLTYHATLTDGSALPLWLSFDPTTRTFSGTPVDSDAGLVSLKVTATDGENLSVAEVFDVMVTIPNLVLTGTASHDVLTGGAGHDQLFGLAGSDTLNGAAGHDLLDGGAGNDTMVGSTGNDTYVVDAPGDVVTESANEGTDTVQTSLLAYTLGANVENLMLTGTGPSVGIGNALSNQLTGDSGANLLDGRGGADTMAGGAGNDVYMVDQVGDAVIEAINEGIDTVSSSVTYSLGAYVENLILTGSAVINATGNELDNTLTSNSAANVLMGLAGNDTYVIGAGDTIIETEHNGTDTVVSSLTHTLAANVENLTLVGFNAINGTGNDLDNVLDGLLNLAGNTLAGGAGNDTYVIGSGDTVVEAVGGGTDTVQTGVTHTLGANVENLTLTGANAVNGTGNGLNNILIGNNANNVLNGGSGNDTLIGGQGNDVLIGGIGNDTFRFSRGEGQDLVRDNGGTADKLLYDSGIDPLDLIISRQANDLRLAIHGSTDMVTIQNWYTGTANRTETIQAGNGQTLLSTQVDQLIQAMAAFTQQSGLTWDQAIDQRPQDVQAVLAASWQ